MIYKALKEILDGVGDFSESFKSELHAIMHPEIYKNKQIVHAAGQIESNLYLIESGFARSYYYDKSGLEHTVKFWMKGDLIFSYEGYYKVPSFYYTEFMETSHTVALSYHDLVALVKLFPETSTLIRYALLRNRKEEYERQNILTLPAHEKYARLLKISPVIFQKSPAKFIASYLNMSRETLARLMGRQY